jgi:succinyl-CoA synthetase beta subunit
MEYMARPVVDLRTTDAVKGIVTVPLVVRLKGLQRDVARRIAEA